MLWLQAIKMKGNERHTRAIIRRQRNTQTQLKDFQIKEGF